MSKYSPQVLSFAVYSSPTHMDRYELNGPWYALKNNSEIQNEAKKQINQQ